MRNLPFLILWAASAFGQRPLEYFLDLRLDPAAPRYQGRVAIDVELTEERRTLALHAVGLDISQATVAGQAAQVYSLPEDEQILLEVPQEISPGRVRVELEFSGSLSDRSQEGLYRRAHQGQWYAFTMFTAIEARRAFPCFDEPRFKTPWNLVLRVPEGLIAAANTPVRAEQPFERGWKRVEFGRTAVLPTEVLAFTVGPWDVHPGPPVGARQVPSRILAARGTPAERVRAALEAAPVMVARLEEYVGLPYPWEKLDQVGLLANAFGAVENPGLITYRSDLLFPEKTDRIAAMRGVMAHELAHQWFGNLVTQSSWEDVWLSEGFATLLGYRTADLDLPESERGRAIAEARRRMLARDGTPQSRAVRVPKSRRAEMKDVYAGEVYGKAAAILAMLEEWLGPDTFERALRRYLREHAGRTATLADFARALRAESETEVAPVLEAFLNRRGSPTVSLRLDCTQASPRLEAEFTPGWTAPICVRTPAGKQCAVITGRGTLPLSDRSCPAWVVPNAGGRGYFHSQLDSRLIDAAPLTEAEKAASRSLPATRP